MDGSCNIVWAKPVLDLARYYEIHDRLTPMLALDKALAKLCQIPIRNVKIVGERKAQEARA